MSVRDRRSQRIRDQIRAQPNPRSGQGTLLPRSLQDQLRRVYGGEGGVPSSHDTVAAELARLARRRR